jgi:hypothetical protein
VPTLMRILRQSTSTTLRTYSSVRSALEARSGWICLRPHFAEFLRVRTYEEVYAWNEQLNGDTRIIHFHFQTIIVILEIAREVIEPFFFFFFFFFDLFAVRIGKEWLSMGFTYVIWVFLCYCIFVS